MSISCVQVQMLGRFSIRIGDAEITDSDNRSVKIWLLLAYLICSGERTLSQDELIGLLSQDEDDSANPVNALKTLFHRARTLLNRLEPDAGRTLILNRDGSYLWNREIPLTVDAEEFDSLCGAAAEEEDAARRQSLQQQALALYRGAFLPKLSGDPWVISNAAYLQNLYRQTLIALLPALEAQSRYDEIAEQCSRAIELEPYDEQLYQYLMRAHIARDNRRAAVAVYEDMSELLFSNFGIMPSEESKALYREAARTLDEKTLSPSSLRELLREPDTAPGALVCDYDVFRAIYQANARAAVRTGIAAHVALLTVSGKDGEPLPKRSLERCMNNLQELVRLNLRRGDVVARCSVSQLIVLLSQANYEDSCMVCQRILRAFRRQYPHAPAVLHFSVQPLEPNV